jgi:L-threonylcarbamoyladenylate synthase
VLDGGPCQVGIESTVISIVDGSLRLLRPGMIHFPDLEQAASPSDAAHPAPGMHPRHYSPRTPLLIVAGPAELPDETGAYVWHTQPADCERVYQLPRDPEQYAARLYATLHDLDTAELPWIALEAVPNTRAWDAIRDRVSRAKA